MNKLVFRLLLLFSALSFLALAVLYPSMPAIMPSHWNANGFVDGFSPRWVILLLGLLPLGATLLFWFIPRIDPRRKNFQKYPKAYNAIAIAVCGMLIALVWVTTLAGLGTRLPIGKLIPLLVGVLLVVMGNFMPQLRSNYFAGIRTPWALANDEVWRKTHRAGGVAFCIMGAVYILSVFLPGWLAAALPTTLTLGSIAFVYVYSYLVYRRLAGKTPPGEE